MIVTIFLGPSMPVKEARKILPNAIFRPPAAQGDLLTAVDKDNADTLGLIDGTFLQNLSVWHNEICYLLSRGITIYGASSMGALRAVETDRFGMIGIGKIYSWYKDGIITGDDEVALLHGDERSNFRSLSMPLVNIRASINRAVSDELLDKKYADELIKIAHSLHFPNRVLPVILERCRHSRFPDEVINATERALTLNYVDLKRDDASELLLTIAQLMDGSLKRPKPISFEFTRSSLFETLYNLDRKVPVGRGVISLQEIAEHVALQCPDFEEIRRSSLYRSVALFLGRLLDVRVTKDDVAAEREAFCDRHGLSSDKLLTEWLRSNCYSERDLSEYLAQEAVCSRLRLWALKARGFDRGCRALLDELRMRGTFPFWAKEALEASKVVAIYQAQPEYKYVWSEDPALLAERHATYGRVRIRGDARVWAEDAGFEGVEGLEDAVRRAVIFDDVRERISKLVNSVEQNKSSQ